MPAEEDNLLLVILRKSRSFIEALWLYVVGHRLDVWGAVLVFQDAFNRPGSCHSHTMTVRQPVFLAER